jgi:glycosyltransferase involved in cell wall biosynthesis
MHTTTAHTSVTTTPPRAHRVLFVTAANCYGGTEKHLLDLLQRCGGIQPLILCTRRDPFSSRLPMNAAMHVVVMRETALTSLWRWLRLFRRVRPDVVVFINNVLTVYQWYVYLAARLAAIPRVHTIQHMLPPSMPPRCRARSIRSVLVTLGGWRTRHLLGLRVGALLCNTTICVSNAIRRALVRDYHFPSKRTITIHNGVSVSTFAPREHVTHYDHADLAKRSAEFIVVCTARLSEQKGLDILLEAIRIAVCSGVPCRCFIVGDGPLRDSLQARIHSYDLAGRVLLEGFKDDVRPYLHIAHAFVLTSYREGLPLSILEALACGVPCVVTDVGGNAEAVAHRTNGLVVMAGCPEQVADAIAYLWHNPGEQSRMSKLARLTACETFDIDTQMRDLRQVLLDGCDNTHRRSTPKTH